jgi:hypothetical protein
MRQLKWAFFHVRLWAFELKLWLDGLSWEQVRIVAERSKHLARATYERSELQDRLRADFSRLQGGT